MLKISLAPENLRATSKVCVFPIDGVGLSLLGLFMKHMNWLPHCSQGAAVSIPGPLERGDEKPVWSDPMALPTATKYALCGGCP